jgi:bis(5'-nucleosidyl)-tetraphosphatase
MPYVPKACGFVVARPEGAGWRWLLLTSRKWGEPGFAKGHVDPGESEVETARRETAEETGLAALDPVPGFRAVLEYPVVREGKPYDKTVVYFLAKVDPEGRDVRLSDEHTESGWYALAEALARLPFESLRGVLRDAALHLKDPALFDLEPATEAEADVFLQALPAADETLVAHLRGAARLGRAFAEALAEAGEPVHVEAAAIGTLLHDTGRAVGDNRDHARAGLRYLRTTRFSPYALTCISHFTKGASADELVAAGLPADEVEDYVSLIDGSTFTWEERCAALADACMDITQPAPPALRFAALRERYPDGDALISLQERRTQVIREQLEAAIGGDPLALVGLA